MGSKNQLMVRGVRGAISVTRDDADEILEATRRLLMTIMVHNDMATEEIASIWFTTTPDLVSCFPALAARQLGWTDVPLMCGHEMSVVGALPLSVRVLIHWNTAKSQKEINHIYLGETVKLRPDKTPFPQIDDSELKSYLLEKGVIQAFPVEKVSEEHIFNGSVTEGLEDNR